MSDRENSRRAKMLGVLIQDAREFSGRTADECAEVVGITPEQFEQAEKGGYDISLPELEALAIFLGVPMGHFWGSETLESEPEPNYGQMITLRHRVVGVILRQLRLKSQKTHQELADALGVDVATIQSYESGRTSVPYLHLEQLCRTMGAGVDQFMENHGPLGRHEAAYRLRKQFNQMSPEMQAFLINPVNIRYLETAKKLSEMDVAKLRQVAENILDITF
ncbi:MAG: transcriptional regulator [Ardenticatenaceae bacterium]|nr:transcriptional regulator [Ardenticatenaceae bacterium]MCB9443645.1 transcriptional regulator [Ardenticatenaceae bacterium]